MEIAADPTIDAPVGQPANDLASVENIVSQIALIGAVGFILVLGIFAFIKQAANPQLQSTQPQPPSAQTSAPLASEVLRNPAVGLDRQPACVGEASSRPRSSAEIGGRHRGGRGRIDVENGTNLDAVVVLAQGNEGKRAIYVRARESGVMTSIPVGDYRIQFQLGERWLTKRRFCSVTATSEFADTFDFVEEDESDGIRYSRFEITLHEVMGGNARAAQISPERFLLPAAE